MKIVLGSKSPRRKEILSLVCDDFEIRVSDADESYSPDTPLSEVPRILAERKAMAIEMAEDEIIIGSDTVKFDVVPGNEVPQPDMTEYENAELICFLASNEASYISGQNIQIDGCRKKM